MQLILDLGFLCKRERDSREEKTDDESGVGPILSLVTRVVAHHHAVSPTLFVFEYRIAL